MHNLIYDVFYFVIPDSTNEQALVKSSVQPDHSMKYSLPHVSSPRFTCEEDLDDPEYDQAIIVGSWNGHTILLCESARENLGLDLYCRDIVWYRKDDSDSREKGREDTVLLADLKGDTVLPQHCCWVPLKQVSELSWESISPSVKTSELMLSVMETQSSRTSLANHTEWGTHSKLHLYRDLDARLMSVTQPWRRQGWITEIESWFTSAMQEQGFCIPHGNSLMQWRNMHYSTVLRCKVESEKDPALTCELSDVYLKIACSNFTEALITRAVASHFPDVVPKVLVTKDDYTFVQVDTYDSNDVSEREIIRVLADMQIRSAVNVESLRAAGVPYRGLDWHAHQIVEILRHPLVYSFQDKEFYKNLRAHINHFQTLLAELASYNIPHALVHGDFNFDNIRADSSKPDSPRFIDWATACIGYPFLDFFRISEIEFDGIREEDATKLYFNAWRHYECNENIERAFQLTELVLSSDNLHIVVKQCEAANDLERPDFLMYVGSCIEALMESIDDCISSRNSNSEVGEGTSLLIITKDGGHRILVKKSEDELLLPVVKAFGISRITDKVLDGHGMHQLIKAQLGIDTRVVRGLWVRQAAGQFRKIATVLEALDEENGVVPGHKWMREGDLKAFENKNDEDYSTVEAFFREIGDQETIFLRTPWCEFGWLMHTKKLLDTAFRKKGLEILAGPYEMKTDAFSTVWKCFVKDTRQGSSHEQKEECQSIYVKSSVLDLSEGRLLSIMSSFACGLVPSVIEMDLPSNMFAMTDVGRVKKNRIDLPLVLKGLGRLQKSSIPYSDQLHKAGLPKYSCSWVKKNTERILEDALLITQGDENVSFSQSIDKHAIIRYMEELDLLDVPLTLVHGDFHTGNIALEVTDGHKIFDWGSAFIGHPFADAAVITRTSNCSESKAVEGYFPVWKDMISEAEFRKAIGQAFVYYWMVNTKSLLQQIMAMPITDRFFVKDRVVWSLRHLSTALKHMPR